MYFDSIAQFKYSAALRALKLAGLLSPGRSRARHTSRIFKQLSRLRAAL